MNADKTVIALQGDSAAKIIKGEVHSGTAVTPLFITNLTIL